VYLVGKANLEKDFSEIIYFHDFNLLFLKSFIRQTL
jgi:hypothetical protein